jgi:hypothetical protein
VGSSLRLQTPEYENKPTPLGPSSLTLFCQPPKMPAMIVRGNGGLGDKGPFDIIDATCPNFRRKLGSTIGDACILAHFDELQT